ncbi:hypothetical protein D3C80_1287090 [compost metagenome]
MIAVSAYLYATRPLASFTKLSPSRIAINLGLSPNPFVIAVAETASGGETIAPSKKANGQDISSISQCAKTATNPVVKNTKPTAAKVIGRMDCLKSDQLVCQAA